MTRPRLNPVLLGQFDLGSAEGEGVGVDAGIKKTDHEFAVAHFAGLPDELIEAMAGDDALAVGVNIDPMRIARIPAVDRHAEAHGLAVGGRAKHEMQITRMEAIDNAAVRGTQVRMLAADRPGSDEAPLVQAGRPGA
jgi:hypothetical protein